MGDQSLLFDAQPIHLGPFTLKGVDITVRGTPSKGEWVGALEFSINAEHSSRRWIAKLWRYGKNRPDIARDIEEIISNAGITVAPHTLDNWSSTIEKVSPEAERLAPTWAHLRAVQSLPHDVQEEILEVAREEDLDSRDTEQLIRARKQRTILQGKAVLRGKYRVLYADPPWPYRDQHVSGSSARVNFKTMTIPDICKLPVRAHSLDDSVLLMWTTPATMYDDPGPIDVVKAWGYTYKQQLIWQKPNHVHSHYVNARHEVLLICTRGSCLPEKKFDSVQAAGKDRREHSTKPIDFYRIIEQMYPQGPYLELFATFKRDGWTAFGNDARLWESEAKKGAA